MSAKEMSPFMKWLRAQRTRHDAIGDLARDLHHDRCANGVRTIQGLDRHIESHGGSDLALHARDRAWLEWVKYRKALS